MTVMGAGGLLRQLSAALAGADSTPDAIANPDWSAG